MTAARQTVCLCMIVKNEAAVIRRCLDSVRPLIDHWLIVDTGIDRWHAGPRPQTFRWPAGHAGNERPWQDFAHNRSEALSLARPLGDYSLIIDADDEMLVPPIYRLPLLTRDLLRRRHRGWRHRLPAHATREQRAAMAISRRLARVPDLRGGRGRGEGICRFACAATTMAGAGATPPHTTTTVAVLKTALAGETDPFLTSRYTFYLAQSHRDCGEFDAAIDAYLRRAGLGHWESGNLLQPLSGRQDDGGPRPRPRGDPRHPTSAPRMHARRGPRQPMARADIVGSGMISWGGFAIAKPAIDLAAPAGGLFVETWIYEFGLLDEYAVNAYWVGDDEACAGACRAILRTQNVPSGDRERAAQNLKFALDRLRPDHRGASANKPDAAATSNWQPDRPLGGHQLMVEGPQVASRLGPRQDLARHQCAAGAARARQAFNRLDAP